MNKIDQIVASLEGVGMPVNFRATMRGALYEAMELGKAEGGSYAVKLEALLKPFAEIHIPGDPGIDASDYPNVKVALPVADIKAIRAALSKNTTSSEPADANVIGLRSLTKEALAGEGRCAHLQVIMRDGGMTCGDCGAAVSHEKSLPGVFTARGSMFRKKPVVIEAVEWNESMRTLAKLEAMGMVWTHYNGHRDTPDLCTNLRIKTLEGQYSASLGDWIIKGVKGEFYPCKPDIFALTYEPATAVPSQGNPA